MPKRNQKGMARIVMQKVVSSNLSKVGYDAGSRTLRIEFKKGAGYTYVYAGVPPATYTRLLKAKSVGEYFTAYIKSRYPFTKE